MTLKITWHDSHRGPINPPNPNFPNGIDVDLSRGAALSCQTVLPYPAKRCGQYLIRCETCGYAAILTTAGRVDDPRSVKVACKRTH